MKESLNQFQESNKRSIRGTQKNRIRGFKGIQRDPRRSKETQGDPKIQKRPKETLESGD